LRNTILLSSMCIAIGMPPGMPEFALTDFLFGFHLPSWLVKFSPLCYRHGPNGPSLHLVSSSSRISSWLSGGDCHAISLSCQLFILTSLPYGILLFFRSRLLFCICLLTSVLFLPRKGWPTLPCPPKHFGTGNKRHCCVGCRQGLSVDPYYVIPSSFSDCGFPFSDGSLAYPCHSAYHTGCFLVGPPFVSRRKNVSTGTSGQ
jgi:hypothetical protein